MTYYREAEHDDPDMKGERARNKDGTLRRVRSDKTVGHFEKQFDIDTGHRKDMHLGTLMEHLDIESETELVKYYRNK